MTTAVGRFPQADRVARKGVRRVFRPRRMWPALVAAILLTAIGAGLVWGAGVLRWTHASAEAHGWSFAEGDVVLEVT